MKINLNIDHSKFILRFCLEGRFSRPLSRQSFLLVKFFTPINRYKPGLATKSQPNFRAKYKNKSFLTFDCLKLILPINKWS